MERPPRPRSEGVIQPRAARPRLAVPRADRGGARARRLLLRAAPRRLEPGRRRSAPGTPLHDAYLQATTMTFAGIVACQIGTAFAARTERASLRSVGLFTQPAAALGHRLRARLRGRAHLRAAAADAVRHGGRSAAPSSRCSAALPARRLGRRRVSPPARPAPHPVGAEASSTRRRRREPWCARSALGRENPGAGRPTMPGRLGGGFESAASCR